MIIQQIMLSLCEIIQEKPNEDANKSTGSLNSDGSKKIFRSSTQPEIRITGRTSLPANYKPLSQMVRLIFRCSTSLKFRLFKQFYWTVFFRWSQTYCVQFRQIIRSIQNHQVEKLQFVKRHSPLKIPNRFFHKILTTC